MLIPHNRGLALNHRKITKDIIIRSQVADIDTIRVRDDVLVCEIEGCE